MATLTEHQRQGATVAGLQIASAVALFITLGHSAGQSRKEVRDAFLQCCEELYDETAAELSETPAPPQPVAWSYKVAKAINGEGVYSMWSETIVTTYPPAVPEGAVRDLTPLYARPVIDA